MYEHFLAYRFANGEVEGFKGCGFTKARAKTDAVNQIRRKIDHTLWPPEPFHKFDLTRLIETPIGITIEDLKIIRSDWKTNLRY